MSANSFSHVVRADRVPAQGKHVRIEANESERQALTRTLGIVDVAALSVELEVRPLGARAFSVRGTVSAEVVQTDVVTLEPVRQDLKEEIDVTLVPAEEAAGAGRQSSPPGQETTQDRDVYRNGQIDLGVIAAEHLALGLDPYPRAPGVEFTGHVEDDSPAGASPFAALEQLRRDQK